MKEILKLLREKRGLSQNAVATYLGISRLMYIKYESGVVEPSIKTVKLLCKLYDVSYDIILDNLTSSVQDTSKSTEYKISPPKLIEVADGYPSQNVDVNTNLLPQIFSVVPALLYSEKAKLLNFVAQSMTSDVEAGKLAQHAHAINDENEEVKRKQQLFTSFLEKARKMEIKTNGIKWSRDELYER